MMLIGAMTVGLSLLERAKMAVSPGTSGTLAGAQFKGLFQILSAAPGGVGNHVCAGLIIDDRIRAPSAATERRR